MDRFTALNVFRTVVAEQSFAGAARRLNLSPAAISKNIAELEVSLGVRLLNRTTRRLSLTDGGALYLERANRILDELEEADRLLSGLAGEVSGRLRVSAPLTLGLIALSPLIPAYMRRHPRLTLDLDLDDRRVDMVREGFDIVVRGGMALEDSRLIARRIATLPYTICASPDYLKARGCPGRPEALRDHDVVHFSLPTPGRRLTLERERERIEVPVTPRYSVTSSFAVRDALKGGLGLGRIPELYVREEIERGDLEQVLPEWSVGVLKVYAVYQSNKNLPPKITSFVELLLEAFATEGGGSQR